jgi:hypothetical protein
VKTSPVVEGWRAEGKAEGRVEGAIEARRDDVLRLLNLKFPGQVSDDLVAALEARDDLDELSRWLDAVVTSSTLRRFRAAVGA